MSYDPCGTQKLEGNALLQRLAEALGMTTEELVNVVTAYKANVKSSK